MNDKDQHVSELQKRETSKKNYFFLNRDSENYEPSLLQMKELYRQTKPWTGGRTFEDGKRYRFEVDIDKIEREEDTNRLLYSCLYYEDEDKEDMYWMSQDGFETQGLLDVLD